MLPVTAAHVGFEPTLKAGAASEPIQYELFASGSGAHAGQRVLKLTVVLGAWVRNPLVPLRVTKPCAFGPTRL